MIISLHYIKIAFRNLLKYRTQNFISIIGLTVGFVCFAIASLWIHYEMTYDDFHKDAEYMYLVREKSDTDPSGISEVTPYLLSSHLKSVFPDIEKACALQNWKTEITYNETTHKTNILNVDSSFIDMFGIRIITGNNHFLQNGSHEVAITYKLAQKLFGKENPLGKRIGEDAKDRIIGAVIEDWPWNSNLAFELIGAMHKYEEWNISCYQTYIKLKQGTDIEDFTKKICNYKRNKDADNENLLITPLTRLRYENPITDPDVKFNHIILLVLSGGLLILCSLFNFLTLFFSRIKMRTKEMALRKVCGSSNTGLIVMLCTEFFYIMLISLLCSFLLIELALPAFRTLSKINSGITRIYMEMSIYTGGIILIALLLAAVLIHFYLQHSSLSASMKNARNHYLRKSSMIFQLIISIGFTFCSIVMVKQIHYLNHTDLGFKIKNTASAYLFSNRGSEELWKYISQIPETAEILEGSHIALLPQRYTLFWKVMPEGKSKNEKIPRIEVIEETQAYCNFYHMTLLKGEMLTANNTSNTAMINETAAKIFGWYDPIGKKFTNTKDNQTFTVTGLIKDFYKDSPTTSAKPALFITGNTQTSSQKIEILFRYHEGQWKKCKENIENIVKKNMPGTQIFIYNTEKEYNLFLKSEIALFKLLSIISLVCIVIAIFGVFSQATLDCEQRQKEIAIRKVNGASTWDISGMFFKEYFTLLLLAAAIAFPVSYMIMKSWLQNYSRQTTVDFWIYAVIFFIIGLVMSISIGWKIWKTSRQNPSEIIKNE